MNTDNSKSLKTAGIMLIISGIGIPVMSAIVTALFIAISHDEFSGLIVLFTWPVIVVPIWALPVVGGIFALKRKHYTFVLVSAYAALFYWIPFIAFIIFDAKYIFKDETALFWLYLPVLVLSIPALVNIIRGRDRFNP